MVMRSCAAFEALDDDHAAAAAGATPAALTSPHAQMAGVRKAPRHEIASGGSGPAVPQEGATAKRLWRFWYAGDAEDVAARRAERCFCAIDTIRESVRTSAQ